jgi:type I restriction enzyme M protein
MQLTRTAKTSDIYGRYYTDQEVANLLIRSICRRSPKLILDLGCGGGMLINAARKQWAASEYVTADIDANVNDMDQAQTSGGSLKHYVLDVLSDAVDKKIGVSFGSVDVGLCNPPYIRPKWRKHFGEILEGAGLSHIAPRVGSLPAEVLFLAQNLRFLRPRGKLGLILPDGIISGEKFQGLRMALAHSHRIEKVVELPRGVFQKTDAKAHILVLSKAVSPNDVISVQRVGHDGILTEPISIHTEDAAKRLDYSYLISQASSTRARKSGIVLRDSTVFVKRGAHSSAARKIFNLPIFHTTDFTSDPFQIPSKFVVKFSEAAGVAGVVAQKGDILLARVGRNLAKKVCMVTRGYVIVTDCIIVLRVRDEHRDLVFQYLVSRKGSQALASISHGVGAQFITIDGILELAIA